MSPYTLHQEEKEDESIINDKNDIILLLDMKESISIKNLGPVKDVTISDIRPLTVFIGKSGSGKSTILKAIALFRWVYKMYNIRSYLKRSNISKSPFRFRMDTYLKDSGLDQYISKDTEITYTVEQQSERSYTLKYANGKLQGATNKNLIRTEDLQYSKIAFVSEQRSLIPIWADKGAASSGAFLGYYFHQVYNDFEEASASLQEMVMPYFDMKFKVIKEKQSKKYLVKSLEGNYEIDMKNSSSGMQTSIPILLIAGHYSNRFDFDSSFNRALLQYFTETDSIINFRPVKNLGDIKKKLYIHIEEPELSLFPDAQCAVMNDLIAQCFVNNTNDVTLMFSTHSPYIINHLNLLIKAYDTDNTTETNGAKINFDDLAVYQVCNGELYSLKLKNERLINTNPLSDTINNIYDRYESL